MGTYLITEVLSFSMLGIILRGLCMSTFLLGGQTAGDSPEQIHIAYAGANSNGYPDGMTISWATMGPGDPVVRFSQNPAILNEVAGGDTMYYEVPGGKYHHHVVLSGLSSHTKYFYQCGMKNSDIWSELKHFTTARTKNDTDAFKVVVFGDMSFGSASENTIKQLTDIANEGLADFIWHLGDIAYADESWRVSPIWEFKYEIIYNQFMNRCQDFASIIPWMVLPGNHEAECHEPYCQTHPQVVKTLANFTAYQSRFRMPSKASGGVGNMWYSFNYQNLHIINFNTETDYPNAPANQYTILGGPHGGFGDQLTWLEDDLKRANEARHLRPWILVAGHRPLYSLTCAEAKNGYCQKLQNAFEDLFVKYKVDIVFAGHLHAYERHYPVYQNTHFLSHTNPEKPVYIVAGAAGSVEGHAANKYKGKKPQPWNAFVNFKDWGYGILDVLSDTEIRWDFLASETNEIIDTVTIKKDLLAEPLRLDR